MLAGLVQEWRHRRALSQCLHGAVRSGHGPLPDPHQHDRQRSSHGAADRPCHGNTTDYDVAGVMSEDQTDCGRCLGEHVMTCDEGQVDRTELSACSPDVVLVQASS